MCIYHKVKAKVERDLSFPRNFGYESELIKVGATLNYFHVELDAIT